MTDTLGSSFHPNHLADLRRSGLSDETILEAGIKSVCPRDIDKIPGYETYIKSMYEIPYPGADYSRYKAFYDEADKFNPKTGDDRPKYLAKKDSGNRLYIPAKARPFLNELSVPLYITEGEKKALKACQEGLCCIAISGLWNWSDGNKNLIPDFNQITLDGKTTHIVPGVKMNGEDCYGYLDGKTVYIVPDSHFREPDRHGKQKNLKQAAYELAYLLIDKGAKVFWVELSKGDIEVKLDDYLCNHSVEDFKKLPVHKIRKLTIQEAIDNVSLETPFDETKEILKRIGSIPFESEQAIYIKRLSEKTGIPKRRLQKDLKLFIEKWQPEQVVDSNITIAHPSYEVNSDFMSLGFRETVISGDHTEDRNLYLISRDGKYELCQDTMTKKETGTLLFDVRERMLININEKWSKVGLLAFVKNPTAPAGLYQETKQILRQYVELGGEGNYGLLASWIMATYFHRCFNAMPFVFFYGKKGCGKTRGLDLLERLAFNAYKTKGVSVASLADSIDATRSTFLNDQAESLSNPKNEEILGILADSYTIGGGKRRIVVLSNKNRKVVEFETYSPKAFASIKDIDSDLKDRCILFPMIRALREYPYPEAHLPVWGAMRDKLYRLLLARWKDAKEIYQTAGEGVSHRVKELWKPLETILRLEGVPQEEQKEVMSVFLESMQETQVELSDHENGLFETLLKMLEEPRQGVFSVLEIAGRIEHDGILSDKALQTWIGNTIKQMGIYTSKMPRKDKKRAYLFDYNRVKNIYDRYTLKTGGIGGIGGSAQQIQGITGYHLKNIGGNEVVCGGSSNIADTTYDHLRPPTKKIGGISETLTGQGKAGGVPPIPPKMTEIEKEILEKVSNETIDLDLLEAEL